jgi:hypothetical protein
MEAVTTPTATLSPAAPAPTVDTPATQTAVQSAVSKSPQEYREARRAERAGKPLPPVPVTPGEGDVPPAAPQLSKRQQKINAAAERAVDSATATLQEENARLKAQLASASPKAPEPPKPAAAAPAPPAEIPKTFPSLAEYSEKHPNASLEDFLNARDDWKDQRRAADAHSQAETDELTAAQRARVETFVGRLNETKAADPTFVSKLTDEVKALRPFGAVTPGDATGPRNVIAEQIYDSQKPSIRKPLPVKRGDTRAYREIRRQERLARLGR